MRFAFKTDGVWVAQSLGTEQVKLSDGMPVRPGEKGWTLALAEACGFYPIQDVRPSEAAAEGFRWDRTLEEVAGQPTFVYVQVALTAEELAAIAEREAEDQEQRLARLARTELQAFIDDPNVTAADAMVMVKKHSRILIHIINTLGDPDE